NAPPGTRLYQRLKKEKRLLPGGSGDNTDGTINFIPKMVLSQLQCSELYVNEASAATAVHNREGLIEFGFYGSD
ncbi:unnamed protein product, partial [marine sediment metagenome]